MKTYSNVAGGAGFVILLGVYQFCYTAFRSCVAYRTALNITLLKF